MERKANQGVPLDKGERYIAHLTEQITGLFSASVKFGLKYRTHTVYEPECEYMYEYVMMTKISSREKENMLFIKKTWLKKRYLQYGW